ncbi:hypothetical protein [Paenibacillus fonticola]|uniref:hypothetical protein n=1 Tax=Paenibacillus fonticola TaxID=379896 RepID=UPI000370E53C|nr:hypothetical protein [Paenibacillus fonticola]
MLNHWSLDNWLTLGSVTISAIFSFLLWQATRRSTKAAEASTKLSQNIEDERKQIKAALRSQLILEIRRQADEMLDFLNAHRRNKVGITETTVLPQTPTVPAYYIAEYFSEEDRILINTAWESYREYVKDFWTSDDLRIGRFNQSKNDDQKAAALHDLQVKFLNISNNLQ